MLAEKRPGKQNHIKKLLGNHTQMTEKNAMK